MPSRSGRRRAGIAIVVAVFQVIVAPLTAQDVRMRVGPQLIVPVTDLDVYGLGGGASLVFDADVLDFLAPYVGIDVRLIAPAASELDASLLLASGGIGLGGFAFPLPRLKVAASAGIGIYVGSYSGADRSVMTGNLLWRVGAEAGFRVRPSLTVSGGLSYVDYRTQLSSLYRGLTFSLVADLGLGTESAAGRVTLESAESAPVYPIVAADYASSPFGSLTIRNDESAEMRNVEVWFHVAGYTSGPALCGTIPYLPKGATATVPLVAVFSDNVMNVTETVRVSGEVRTFYELLGEARASATETTISILHRNALVWTDPRILAAFVSPNDPAVLDESKYIAGAVRSISRPELDANLQYAIGIFEGLRLARLGWAPDPQTPYEATRASGTAIDYVQYPHQTIAYRGGDSDDLAVLYAAALESIGVPAAVMPLDAEVLVAVRMSRNETAVREMFLDAESFIFLDGEAWVPVRVSMLRDGFLRAWSEGAIAAANAGDRFFRVSDAWRRYPPVGVPGISAVSSPKPPEEQLRTAFSNVVSLVLAREVLPRVERLRASFGPDGGSGRQRNYLGVTYARYGMYAEAKPEFEAAAELGYDGATLNIGTVAYMMGDYAAAVEWYERALETTPRSAAAIIGLARSLYELDRFDEADEFFRRATEIAPELAERYGYLSARLPGSEVRASSATERRGDVLWDE